MANPSTDDQIGSTGDGPVKEEHVIIHIEDLKGPSEHGNSTANDLPQVISGISKMCRVCLESEFLKVEDTNKLISPCKCTGSMAWVHLSCLEHWLVTSKRKECEVCGFIYKFRLIRPNSIEDLRLIECVGYMKYVGDGLGKSCWQGVPQLIYCFGWFWTSIVLMACSTIILMQYMDDKTILTLWMFAGSLATTILATAVFLMAVDKLTSFHMEQWRSWREPKTRLILMLDPLPESAQQNDSPKISSPIISNTTTDLPDSPTSVLTKSNHAKSESVRVSGESLFDSACL